MGNLCVYYRRRRAINDITNYQENPFRTPSLHYEIKNMQEFIDKNKKETNGFENLQGSTN